jgi:hypothetical protein
MRRVVIRIRGQRNKCVVFNYCVVRCERRSEPKTIEGRNAAIREIAGDASPGALPLYTARNRVCCICTRNKGRWTLVVVLVVA